MFTGVSGAVNLYDISWAEGAYIMVITVTVYGLKLQNHGLRSIVIGGWRISLNLTVRLTVC